MNKAVQKALAVLMCIGMCIGLFPVSLAEADAGDGKMITLIEAESFDAARGFAVNASNFPDPTFRAFVEEHCDTDGDLVLNDMEIAAVTEMDVHGLGISDLTGIAEFFYLRKLNCSENSLRYLDVSDLANLEELYCQDNFRSESVLMEETIPVGLAELVPDAALKVLWCYNNNLHSSALNLGMCPDLEYLNCSNNPIGELDLSLVPHLKELRCNNASLSELDLSHSRELRILWCWNDLSTGAWSGIGNSRNEFDRLDLSVCPNLAAVVVNGLREDYAYNVAFFDDVYEVSVTSIAPMTLYLGEDYGEFVVHNESGYYSGHIFGEETDIVALDAAHFPDENFRNALMQYDTDQNGRLSDKELIIISLELSGKNIASLEGIEYLRDLYSLTVDNNQLTSLDLSANTALKHLNCANNQLASLSLAANKKLTSLHCSNNLLESLSLRANRELETLDCANNRLTTLDLAMNTTLRSVNCSSNRLTWLMLGSNNSLASLECSGNQLESLYTESCPGLIELRCSENNLDGLDLDANIKLTDLVCSGNVMSSLDLSRNTGLTYVDCTDNPLKGLNLGTNHVLTRLYCAETYLPLLDIGGCPTLVNTVETGTVTETDGIVLYNRQDGGLLYTTHFDAGLAQLKADSATTLLTEAPLAITAAAFPDDNFREFLQEYDTDSDGKLSGLERYRVSGMDCSNKNIQSMEGVGYFPQLLSLDCSGNSIASLDIGLCPVLQRIVLEGERQTSGGKVIYTDAGGKMHVTIDAATVLVTGSHGEIPISSNYFPDGNFRRYLSEHCDLNHDGLLSREECDSILEMDVSERNITDLTGVEYFGNLTTLNCSWNKLTSLNVSRLSHLGKLYCQNNYFYDDSSLSSAEGFYSSDPTMYDDGTVSMTEAETFDAPVTSGGLSSLIIGSAPLKVLWCYDNCLTALDLSACTTIENLDCAFNLLTSLDVSGLPNLSVLMCHDNNLTELDVSANPELSYLWCWNNPMVSLDVSACPMLAVAAADGIMENFNDHVSLFSNVAEVSVSQNVDLHWGQIETEGIPITEDYFPDSDFRSALRVLADKNYDGVLDFDEIASLDYFDCSGWQISSLEGVNYLTELKYLICRANYLTELDVSSLSKLELLDCSYNRISWLNISGNPLLKVLRATCNNLTSLDLSVNSHLHALWCWYNPLESLDLSNCPVVANLALFGLTERYGGEEYGYYDDNDEYHHEGYTSVFISFYDKSGTGDLSVDEALVTNGGLSAYTIIPIDESTFPDAAFRNYILDSIDGLGGDKDGLLQPWEVEAVREINCSGLHISDLTGIAHFTNLSSLDCSSNDLPLLDISALTSLTDLNCSYNNLTSLDTRHNPGLLTLNCSNNSLIEVSFTNNYALESLDCSHNATLQELCITDCDTIAEFVRTHTPTIKSGVCEYSGSFMREGREIVSVSFRHDAAVQLWAQSYPVPDCVLPRDLQQIGDEAFRGCEFSCVLLSDGIGEIGARAFADSPNLRYIVIPASVTIIPDDAFENVEWLTIVGVPGRDAESYAARMGFLFKPIS